MKTPLYQEKKAVQNTGKLMRTFKQLTPSKKVTKITNTSEEGPGGSDMIGLPKEFIKQQEAIMREASSGPRYKIRKPNEPSSPMKQKKIIEKGSFEKGKQEKYASKAAMAKHEKKESKPFEKKEGVKPKSPMKQLAQHPTKPSVTVKKVPVKMKKC